MEDGNASGLPTKEDQEFRPFVRRLPEFKFWYSTTKAIAIGFFCSWFEVYTYSDVTNCSVRHTLTSERLDFQFTRYESPMYELHVRHTLTLYTNI
jgi:hypothetical protein